MKYQSKELIRILAFAFGLVAMNTVLQKPRRNHYLLAFQAAREERALGERRGRQQALDEVSMVVHGQLQAHVIALQHCLALAEAAPQSLSSQWIEKAQTQARLIQIQVTQLYNTTYETLRSTNLEQAMRDSVASLSVAYPACICRVETLSLPSAHIVPEVQHAVMVVLYNALQNAYRHADPSSILVQLQYAPDVVILVVTDDGCGLPTRDVTFNGRGLGDMQRAVHECGGTFTVESVRGRGTRITAALPYTFSEQQRRGTHHD